MAVTSIKKKGSATSIGVAFVAVDINFLDTKYWNPPYVLL